MINEEYNNLPRDVIKSLAKMEKNNKNHRNKFILT